MSSLIERLNSLVPAPPSFRIERAEDAISAVLIDLECDRNRPMRCDLSAEFLAAVADVDDDDALAILKQIYTSSVLARSAGMARGHREGRKAVVSVVHELLGIDLLVEQMEALTTAVRDVGGLS